MALDGVSSNDLLDLINEAAADAWISRLFNSVDDRLLGGGLFSFESNFDANLHAQATPIEPSPVDVQIAYQSVNLPVSQAVQPEMKELDSDSQEYIPHPSASVVRTKRYKVKQEEILPEKIKGLEGEIESLSAGYEACAAIRDPAERRKAKNAHSAALSRRRKNLQEANMALDIQTLQEDKEQLTKKIGHLEKDKIELITENARLLSVQQALAIENEQLKARLAQIQQGQCEDNSVNMAALLIRFPKTMSSTNKQPNHDASCAATLKFSI